MLRSAAGGAVIQAGSERASVCVCLCVRASVCVCVCVCVSLGERRSDAPSVPQGAREVKARRPRVKVLTPSHQPVPSQTPLAPFSLATLSKAIPR